MPNIFKSLYQKLKPSLSLNKVILLICLLVIMYFGYERYISHRIEQKDTSAFILTPKLNDIYFLDLRLLDDTLASKNKYKLAKVARVSGDHLAIVYGTFFYQWQSAVVNSIKYGDLSNKNYFALIPDYIPLSKIKEMRKSGAIYLVKRPKQNKIYGNIVNVE